MASAKDKKMQIAAELAAVLRLQETAEKLKLATTLNYSDILRDKLHTYLKDSDITMEEFKRTQYYSNIECYTESFIMRCAEKFPNLTFDVLDNTIIGRANRKKGDLVFEFSDGNVMSFSLKNYTKNLGNIQVNSMTFDTFILHILFASPAINQCEYKGNIFNPRNAEDCIHYIKLWAADNNIVAKPFIKVVNTYTAITETILTKYTIGPFAEWWTPKIQKEWKKDCVKYGNEQISVNMLALNSIPKHIIKDSFLKITGLDAKEELLCYFKDRCIDSLTNTKFKNLIKSLHDNAMEVTLSVAGKSICFTASLDKKVLVNVKFPFTLNANGAWHRSNQAEFKATDKVIVQANQRRPIKCKQMRTSVNTYVHLKKAIV